MQAEDEVHADLSRWIFQPEQHYSSIVVQQGRVSLDADANAQASILLHYLRTMATDLIGPFGGPSGDLGFAIGTGQEGQTLEIGPGRYYVDGLLCEADGTASIDYFQQPDGYLSKAPMTITLPDAPYLVVLKVWERFISSVEDPALREVALGLNGPDTTGRTRVLWQVLASPWLQQAAVPADQLSAQAFCQPNGPWDQFKAQFGTPTGTVMVRALQKQQPTDACIMPPTSGYRGPENQLFRVEIHRGGTAPQGTPTYMWSQDNGSVILPITAVNGPVVSVATLGRDPQLSVDAGNYVEIVDDAYATQGEPGPIPRYREPLHRVTSVDPVGLTVTLDSAPTTGAGGDAALHPFLRRWDQDGTGPAIDDGDQAIKLVAGQWTDVEDGIQIYFSEGTYRAGDYWLIPARVITGDVEWPTGPDGPIASPPAGVRYHVAPLAIVGADGSVTDLRSQFAPMAALMPAASPAAASGSQGATGPS